MSDDDDYMYRVYFKDDEIQAALEQQQQDHFEMLMYDKQEAIEDAQQYVGLQTKFNITDFTPRDKSKIEKPQTKKSKRRNTTASVFGDGDEQDLEDSDDSENYKMKGKRTKITKEEAEQKMHELQVSAVENDILNMINQRIESSPRYSQNSSKGSDLKNKSSALAKKRKNKGSSSPSKVDK